MKKKRISIYKSLFGKRFGWSDLILILMIAPYFYFVYQGINYETGFLAIYQRILAPAIAFATIIKLFVQNFVTKIRKLG